VIGDIHTHPSGQVAQSIIDSGHPMISRVGHVALILPRFAQSTCRATDVGVHLYRGSGWTSYFKAQASARLLIGRFV
jgi:hypothetical protein